MENVDPSVYANSTLSDSDKTVIAAVIASYQDAPARPLFSEWGQVWDTWKNGVLSWASVKPASPEAAYAEVQASFKAMMLNF
jgi:arabinogalactan oligomer/maltooligosaccharide transport system substrate-binding protein